MRIFKKTGSKMLASLMALLVMFSIVQLPVHATSTAKSMMFWNAETKTLLNPPTYSSNQAWVGSKLYWGHKNGDISNPMLWDILNTSETSFGGNGILLFYTGDLGKTIFHASSNVYTGSILENFIDTAMGTSLNDEEEAATIASARSDVSYSSSSETWTDNFNGKKWFAPTNRMMNTTTYGFPYSKDSNATRAYSSDTYWLSSAHADYSNYEGRVDPNGTLYDRQVSSEASARVASNVSSETILFISNAESTKGSALANTTSASGKYKLTLKDSNQLTPTITNVEKNGNTVTFDYADVTTGTNQKLSAIITNEDGTEIIQYGVIEDATSNESGSSSITLPADFDTNDYQLKLFSEQCNGDKNTDLASDLASVDFTVKYDVTVNNGTSANTEYAENDAVTITANAPATGKQFKEWTIVSGGITLASSTSNTTTFTMPSNAVEVTATYENVPTPPTPEKPVITTGAGSTHQISNGKDMTLTCTGKLEDLTGIYVDNKLVDKSNYTLKSGSTILTLKASYLDTLSAGKHTLKFQYKDNVSAETTFTITAKAETVKPEEPKSPPTGDTSNTSLYLLLSMTMATCLLVMYSTKKKQKNN